MSAGSLLHPDRLFPADPSTRAVARDLYQAAKVLPIISPHGHTDPSWFAENERFADPASLLVIPDHYLLRMLYSQGISMEKLGVRPIDGARAAVADPREVWRVFAANYFLFRGSPSRVWLDWVFEEAFGLSEPLSRANADHYFDTIEAQLASAEFRPRALMDRYRIEVIATTEDPLDPLASHAKLKADGWDKRVITTFRPDNVLDPEFEGFQQNLDRLSELTSCSTATYTGYLDALRNRREYFRQHGATATDHGHPTARTENLDASDAVALFDRIRSGHFTAEEADMFRGQMLTEMAGMSLEDGMVMQLHPGSYRNHNQQLFQRFSRDKGADIPTQTNYVHALRPLLTRYGNESDLTLILFTLDETAYSRELAPLAGHYPCLKLGPAWWFHDSPEGMRRFREQTTETAGFYNTVGFNDDTRAFLSIPARHDVARRIDCGFLARLVVEHRISGAEALDLIGDLSYNLAKAAYRL